ncbi:MAG: nucleoside deaminase [Bacteroidota bacterium]|nr:nucleoside deaminase [Bacteroidota bacterium]
MLHIYTDEHFMKLALAEAEKAKEAGEIPIGAILVHGNQILSRAHNQTELLKDVTAHAEILAITAASQFLQNKYLKGCTLFISLEPCLMCAAALRWAQIGRIVYAVEDEKQGFMRYGREILHPKTKVHFGLMAAESKELLQQFFVERRKTK